MRIKGSRKRRVERFEIAEGSVDRVRSRTFRVMYFETKKEENQGLCTSEGSLDAPRLSKVTTNGLDIEQERTRNAQNQLAWLEEGESRRY